MAGATFRGRTALDTSGMRRGLAQMRAGIRRFTREVNNFQNRLGRQAVRPRYHLINVRYRPNLDSLKAAFRAGRKMADTFRASVAAPFRELAANMERTIKRVGLAAASLSVLGVRNVFQYEAIQEQFAVLMKDSDAAKKRVAELAELAKKSPFSLTDYTQAAKTLYAVGNEALGTNKMIQTVGDSAAAMGVNMWQASIWVARLYNSLKSGSGVGTTADDMMRAGMLTAENYAKMVTGSRRGKPFEELWGLALKDLSRFEGGMDRLAKTGTGNFMKLKDNIHLASIDMFSGMADSMKDVLYNIDLKMTEMFQNGTFRKWGEKIGEGTRNVVNYIGRIIETWKRLSDSSKSTFKKIILYGGALFLGLRTGLIQPLTQMLFGFGTFFVSATSAVANGINALSGVITLAVQPVLALFPLIFSGIARTIGLFLGIPHAIGTVITGLSTLRGSIVNAYNAFIALLPGFRGRLVATLAFTGKALAALGVGLASFKMGNFLHDVFSDDELDEKRDALKKYLRDVNNAIYSYRVYGSGTEEQYERNVKRKKELEIQLKFLEGQSQPLFDKLKKAAFDNFSLKGLMEPLVSGLNAVENAAIKAFSGTMGYIKDSAGKVWDGLSEKAKESAKRIHEFLVATVGDLAPSELGKKFRTFLDKMLAGAFGKLPEEFKKSLEELRKAWNETEGFLILKAPKLPSIRKQLQTKEALSDVRKIYAYTLRGIYAGWRGVSPFSRKEGGARLTRFKSFASRTNVRRLDDQLEKQRIPDRRRFAGRSAEKFREAAQTVGIPRGVERIAAGVAGAAGAASAAGILPGGVPFPGMFGVIPNGLFNKSHDPGAMVTGAMTPKPSMQTDRTKEITANFGIANGYLRDIRDKIKTFDGAAVYG